MKKIIILIFTIGIFSGCSNEDDSATNNEIIGEWKLIKARIIDFSTNPTIDYSDKNIVYNFKENGILTVTGENNVGYSIGNYEYIFKEDYLGGASSPGEKMILLLNVNNSTKWTYKMSNGQMTLGNSYVDGPDLIFERK